MGVWWSGAEGSTNVGNLSPPSGGGGWNPGVGRDESGYLPTSPHYSGDDSGTSVLSSDNLINQAITPILSDKDKVWELATQAYESNPGYALSFEGKKYSDDLVEKGYAKGSKEHQDKMIQAFGMPNIVATGARTWGDEIYTGKRTDEFGREIPGGDYIYSGLGKALMDQYDQPGSYEDKTGKYWSKRTEQERFEDQQAQHNYGYDYDPGGGYAGGYGTAYGVKGFHRGRPENINPYWQDIAGTPMLPVAGSGAGASMASSDELYALASGKKAFSMTPEEQGILALLNA